VIGPVYTGLTVGCWPGQPETIANDASSTSDTCSVSFAESSALTRTDASAGYDEGIVYQPRRQPKPQPLPVVHMRARLLQDHQTLRASMSVLVAR